MLRFPIDIYYGPNPIENALGFLWRFTADGVEVSTRRRMLTVSFVSPWTVRPARSRVNQRNW